MLRAHRLAILTLVSLAAAVPAHAQKTKTAAKLDAHATHSSALVIDTHADTTQRFLDEKYDAAGPRGNGHWDIPSARKGNLGAEFFSIFVEPTAHKGHWVENALEQIDAVYQQVQRHPQDLQMAYSPADILAAHRAHKIAVLMGLEGGHPIIDSMGLLRDYYRLGVRYMTLTWVNSTSWAKSSGEFGQPGMVQPGAQAPAEPPKDTGLTDYGRDIVREMNRLGMIVDISHVSDRSFYNALTASRAPVIASHSSARAIANHPRNMTDDMLEQLKINGGVAQVNFSCSFVGEDYRKAWDAQRPEREKALAPLEKRLMDTTAADHISYPQFQAAEREWVNKIPRPPYTVIVDHIDHIVKVAGVDHVGIGSDFDGVPCLPQGIDSVADLPKITDELVKRGYTAEQIRKIMGGNLMRVFTEVERVSKQIQAERQRDERKEIAPAAATATK